MQKHRATMPTLLGLCFVASTVAATPAPAALGPATTQTVFDGDYGGAMNLSALGLAPDGPNADPACADRRPATMTVRNGNVYFQYTNWRGDLLHYRGTVTPSGQLETFHTNDDGVRNILSGEISNNGMSGHVDRGPCHYSVRLAKK